MTASARLRSVARRSGRLALVLAALVTCAGAPLAEEAPTIVSHGVSTFGDLRYPAGFAHFDYVNPEAPVGGEFSTWAFGTFDSLNPFILQGNPAAGTGLLFDTLMVSSDDEPDSMYGLLAESIEYPEDRSWAIFTLRPEARFSDGSPVTADDVVFTFETLLEKGQPSYKVTYADFAKVEALDARRVKFSFREGAQTRELPMAAAGLPVFPRAFWEGKDFARSSLEPPLGSGPYLVRSVDAGRSIVYERRPDYWGWDLPVNRGRLNFETVRFEYFADYTAALEAFKGGAYQFRTEYSSVDWATNYNFPALENGWVIKESLPDGRPNGTQGFFFNLRRPIFADPRVREAIGLMFNFEWSNETLFYGIYDRTDSFWENSPLQAEGMPSEAELALLEPLRADLPPEVFDEPAFTPNVSTTNALDRSALREAGRLLDEAGWTMAGQFRKNAGGETLRVEILNDSPSFDRIINPYIENLRRLGVDAVYTRVDNAQRQEREKSFDFDITSRRYVMSSTPGLELRGLFHSDSANVPDASNIMGLANPAIDALIANVEEAQNREELTVAVKALDRALRAMHIWVPNWHNKTHNIAYLDVYRRPEQGLPPYAMGEIDFWWYDAARADELRAAGAF